jgi:glyceraldehyde 3-phosphate dehydrogenase
MSKIKVAINGFGRIGRITARALLNYDNIELVAVNDLTDTNTLAHLFKFDSVQGQFRGTVESDEKSIIINGKKIFIFDYKDPSQLPWKNSGIDVVIESTGKFLTEEDAGKHIEAGAKKVIISAPPKSKTIKQVVVGVNDSVLDGTEKIISNASCTTNCAAPMIKILDEYWGIEEGFLTTVHAYTSDQRLHDAPHRDLRRARAAAMNIVPTSTGAASAITKIFPHLSGKLGGSSMRVPVPAGSVTDITCVLKKKTNAEEINIAFKKEAGESLKSILEYSNKPLVSTDIVGNTHSCIFDSELTLAVGNTVKIIGWYDNEAGYSNRMADLVALLAR